MKVIAIDMFGRESVADKLIYLHVHPWLANYYVANLNYTTSIWYPWSEDHYVVVKDNYPLWRGMEELI